MSEGNGGTLIASGTGFDNATPQAAAILAITSTGTRLTGMSVNVPAGTYWFAVVPQVARLGRRSFNSNT